VWAEATDKELMLWGNNRCGLGRGWHIQYQGVGHLLLSTEYLSNLHSFPFLEYQRSQS
jgi:hypothetical protein